MISGNTACGTTGKKKRHIINGALDFDTGALTPSIR